ncbi:MAG: response regulator, partial [Bacteroidota bacterium]
DLKRPSRVLVVDDNPANRYVVKGILESLNVECIDTDHPKVVAEQLQNQDFGLVLMDIQMPLKDGRTLTKELRKSFDTLPPVVAFTALSVSEERKSWLDSGLMDDFLPKPVAAEDLIELLQKWGIRVSEVDTSEAEEFPPFLDKDVLGQLAKYGGKELIFESFATFKEETQTQLQEAFLSIQMQDWEEVRKVAHTLKGSAGMLGVKPMSGVAIQMEHRLRSDGFYKEVFEDFSNLNQGFKQFTSWLLEVEAF